MICVKKLTNHGQALVEYVLIIAIITVFVVTAMKFLGGYIKDAITKTSCSIMDQEFQEGEKPGEGKCVDTRIDQLK